MRLTPLGLAALLVALPVALWGCGEQNQSAKKSAIDARVNIVLIVADDLGFTDLGAFGGEITTPNLDALARDGVWLTNFHAASSCAPTRAMLMTGTDHHIAGVGTQSHLETPKQSEHRAYRTALLPEVPTIAERLRDAGYRTYASAKWHIGFEAGDLPGGRRFDRSFVLLPGGAGHFDDTPIFEERGKAHWLEDDQPVKLPDSFYSTDEMTDRLLTYIDGTPAGQPFFAYLGYTAPHWPLQAPPEDIEKYRGAYADGWDVLRDKRMRGAIREGVVESGAAAVDFEPGMVAWSDQTEEEAARNIAIMEVYAAMVDRVDQNVGRLVGALRARGEFERTVFVFMSDNGAEAHAMDLRANRDGWLDREFDNSVDNIGAGNSYVALGAGWARATAAPFRDSKSKASEGGIRVPAFVFGPGVGSGVDGAYMRVMDLAPTFLELAGAPVPGDLMGRSQWPRFTGGDAQYSDDEIIAFELYGRRMAQRGTWKALLQEAPYGTGDWQLYDLSTDLGEQRDLSALHPNILAELVAGWEAYAESVGVVLPEVPIPY